MTENTSTRSNKRKIQVSDWSTHLQLWAPRVIRISWGLIAAIATLLIAQLVADQLGHAMNGSAAVPVFRNAVFFYGVMAAGYTAVVLSVLTFVAAWYSR
ncbi:MAG: hypothetical protein AAGK74_00250 [Chloroflexota bacterium]